MKSAEELLAALEAKDLLPPSLIESLRKQLARASTPISADSLAKRLVEKGHLTATIAQRLLGSQPKPSQQPPKSSEQKPEPEDDELGLAPLEEDEPVITRPEKKPAPAKPGAPTRRQKPAEQKPPQPAGAPDASGLDSLLEEELGPLGGDLLAAGTGPWDSLLEGPALDTAAAAGGVLQPVRPRKKGVLRSLAGRKALGRISGFANSPLVWIGGAGLLALVMLGSAVFWGLTRPSGDDLFQSANNDYQAGSCADAADKYTRFLHDFPRHPGAGLARVRQGLCRLRQAARGDGDWPGAFSVAKQVLPEIAEQAEFSEACSELAVILPAIAEGLARQVRKDPDAARVKQAKETLDLIEQHVPKPLRNAAQLAGIEVLLALTDRELARGSELDKALAAIQEAIRQHKTPAAYAARFALLKLYPDLSDDARLSEAMSAVSQAEMAAVRAVRKPRPAETGDFPGPILSAVTLARRTTMAAASGANGRVVFALANGAAYGLDAASGRVLWQRFVGFDTNGRSIGFPPTAVSEKPGSDVILVDAAHAAVLRVEAATGRLRWRHPLGESIDAHPAIAGNRVLAATRSGRLVTIDLESGASSGFVQFPQSLRVAPAIDASRSLVFQVADHSNLYVLSLADNQCKKVVYLGHEPGSVTASPVAAGGFLLVGVNGGADDSTLWVLSTGTDETVAVKPVQQIRLKGHLDTPPLVAGTRVATATDRGAVQLFEIAASETGRPLSRVAELEASGEEDLIRFLLLQGDQLWIADTRLTKYEIQAGQRRLLAKGSSDEASAYQQPLLAAGEVVFHVRRQEGLPGVLVSAVETGEHRKLWEVLVGAPLATEPIVDVQRGTITAVTSAGGLFQIDAAGLKQATVLDQPAVDLEQGEFPEPVTDVVPLDNGRLAASGGEGSQEVAVFDPAETQKRFRRLPLPDVLSCRAIAFGGGLLAPGESGQVSLLDMRSGGKLVEPFQPRLQNGVQLSWRTPATAGADHVILADGRAKLYALAIASQPRPHLAAIAETEMPQPVASPVAVAGSAAYAVDAAGVLAAFRVPGLTRGQTWTLGAPCVWGPRTVGDHVLLATADQQLYCLDANGRRLWQVQLPYGRIAGTPLEAGSSHVLAFAGGTVWRIDSATGKELGKVETGRPLETGPVLLGEHLLLGGHDGTLYEIEQP